jgi:hypothetical protein
VRTGSKETWFDVLAVISTGFLVVFAMLYIGLELLL